MKTTISILIWCALSTGGQENRQIRFPVNEYPRESAIFPRQIRQDTSSYDQQVESFFTEGVTRLTLNLNNYIPYVNHELANTDIAFGPLTIAGALALVLLASIGNTSYEIASAMGLTQLPNYVNSPLSVHKPLSNFLNRIDTHEITSSNGEVVSYATAIFIQYGYPIKQQFLKAVNATYKSDIITLNFRKTSSRAEEVINNWVSKHTNAKIPKLFHGPPSPDTTAIIASVLYFKAAWEFPFFDGHTKLKPFFVNGRHQRSDRNISMMSNGGEFPYFKDRNLNVEIMGFPYKGKKITMYVLLPNDSNQENLYNLQQRLMPEDIHKLVNSTRTAEAVILFPKLKIISSVDLKSVLESVNIRSLFNPQQSNLALMSGGESSVAQNTGAPTTYPQRPTVESQNVQQQSNRNPVAQPTYPQFPAAGTQYNFPTVESQNVQQQINRNPVAQPTYQDQTNYGLNPSSQGTQNYQPIAGQQVIYQQNPLYTGAQNNLLQRPFIGTQINSAQNNNAQSQSQREIHNTQQNPTARGTNNYDSTTRTPYSNQQTTTSTANSERLIFIRNGANGCVDQYNITTRCDDSQSEHTVTNQFRNPIDELDEIRKTPNLPNPGIYADQIIHKVYIEITESGTEAASVTGISLNRSGGRVSFRLDVPFLFFIYHEETKTILFWGSVKNPNPT